MVKNEGKVIVTITGEDATWTNSDGTSRPPELIESDLVSWLEDQYGMKNVKVTVEKEVNKMTHMNKDGQCSVCHRLHDLDEACPLRVASFYVGDAQIPLTDADNAWMKDNGIDILDILEMIEEELADRMGIREYSISGSLLASLTTRGEESGEQFQERR